MHQPLIIQHLFQVSSLEDVSRERLEAFVEAYPSFGIGHYLLSCKLQAEGSERFNQETQRTCLYFSNPLWLQWLIQDSNGVAVARPAEAPAVGVGEPAGEPTAWSPGPVTEEPAMAAEPEAPGYAASEPDAPAYVAPEPEVPVYAAPEPPMDAMQETGTNETPVQETASAAVPIETPNEEATAGNVVTMAEEAFVTPESVATEETSAAEQLLRSIEEARELRESLHKLEENNAETAIAGENLPAEAETQEAAPVPEPGQHLSVTAEPAAHETATESADHETAVEPAALEAAVNAAAQETAAEPAAPYEEPIHDEEAPFVLDETPVTPETPVAETETPAPVAQAAPETPIGPTQQAPEAPKPATTVTQDFLFEPYHTIDYFASQGIKLTLDENPQDKLGKQLKSFTEWLKTMRRLPQKDREVVPDRVAEEAVQTSAAHSILGKDVVTETMAEVLAKQGMREKARAVYEKLSLLNPDKRAYFADKIEQLNIP